MHSLKSISRAGLLLAIIVTLLAAAPLPSARAQSGYGNDFGVICENETAPGSGAYNPTVDLTAMPGFIGIPDGNTIYMWGYSFGNRGYQNPGPTLCFSEGQTVTITLTNHLATPTSIIFPGQTGVQAGGQPVHPDLAHNSLAQYATANDGTMTYTFTAGRAGTFIYESGTDLKQQVQMGLFGVIIVRPQSGNSFVYDWDKTQFNPGNDYLMLLSEIDPDWHAAVEQGQSFDETQYHPRYWQINGRSFPDTIAPNHATWLPNQPYGALLHILPSAKSITGAQTGGDGAGYQPFPSAVRVVNVGTLNHPIHPHGNHVQIIGRDGHPLLGNGGTDLSYLKFDIMTGAGQVWDVLYDWTDVDHYTPSNPVPYGVSTAPNDGDTLLDPHNLNLLFKDPNFFSGSPYLGFQANKNDGTASTYNQCGEYYQIWHSHALNEAANYEAGFGGMITLERIDPPGRFNCQP